MTLLLRVSLLVLCPFLLFLRLPRPWRAAPWCVRCKVGKVEWGDYCDECATEEQCG